MARDQKGRALLLAIDIQCGFMSAETEHLVSRVEKLLRESTAVPVAFTQYQNYLGSPYDRFLNWRQLCTPAEYAITPRLQPFAKKLFPKCGYSALTSDLLAYLETERIDTVYLCGLDTDCCVMTTAVQLFERGIRPVVLEKYCASNGGAESHRAALRVLERLIGAQQIFLDEVQDGNALAHLSAFPADAATV